MNSLKLNYDQIASQYNQRYPASQTWERGQALLELAGQTNAKTILEVGSGTGFWLNLLNQTGAAMYGLDYSMGMLQQAKGQPAPLHLSRGLGTQLPYRSATFDLLYCVDAIHHFGDHRAFILEAYRLLKPGGALAIIGHDPHEGSSNWYAYDYFDTVYDTDLRRYPSGNSVLTWMEQAGFHSITSQVVEHIQNVHVGEAILNDPFLKHNATSQLALLDEQTYEAGLERIKQALSAAKESGEQILFRSDIHVKMFLGYKPRSIYSA
ncbi:MAG: class I SAM-dependent methyltransferase [Anaerolineae bacterium]|nr:class I SAM-dependent methyltransferase [Anaerolineae bacterium]